MSMNPGSATSVKNAYYICDLYILLCMYRDIYILGIWSEIGYMSIGLIPSMMFIIFFHKLYLEHDNNVLILYFYQVQMLIRIVSFHLIFDIIHECKNGTGLNLIEIVN